MKIVIRHPMHRRHLRSRHRPSQEANCPRKTSPKKASTHHLISRTMPKHLQECHRAQTTTTARLWST